MWHSSLTEKQARSIERCQAVALRVILGEMYISYEAACEMTGLGKLSDRRSARCLEYGLKSLKHSQNSRFFLRNPSLDIQLQVRNFARTAQYKNSANPDIQSRLNEYTSHHAEAAEGVPGGRRPGVSGQGAGGDAQARGLARGQGQGHGVITNT